MSEQGKHTPGEWKFVTDRFNSNDHLDKAGSVVCEDEYGNEWFVAEVCSHAGANSDEIANGHLLSAAPDLLAACKALAVIPVERFSRGNGPGKTPDSVIYAWHMSEGAPVELTVGHVLAARAAIAKAEGTTP